MFSVNESGMQFGDYDEKNVYHIENSELHKSLRGSIRTVEFLYLKKGEKLLFIEAKSSTPRKETSQERYNEFINEITDKFIHSFNMLLSYHCNRTLKDTTIGENIQNMNYETSLFIFILVISGHDETWCLPLQEELNRRMKYHNKIWKSKILVVNDKTAKCKLHLIQ